jgi:acyl-CoA thioester hydrolase
LKVRGRARLGTGRWAEAIRFGHTPATIEDEAGMTRTAPEVSPTLAPFEATVRPEWVDYNGHMNVAYYVLAFDRATDVLLDALGLGESYRRAHDGSVFVVESHVTYRRELRAGDAMRIETLVLDHDDKRLHGFARMFRAADGELAATYEFLGLHVDMAVRRAAPFPAAARERIHGLAERHAKIPRPAEAGRGIGSLSTE